MRYMVIVKASQESEAGVMPEEQLIAEMASYHEELAKAGLLIEGTGLQPSSKGWRIKYSGNQRTFVDGPFAETKELIAGYTLLQAKSREEAVEWTRRFPNPAGAGKEAEIEVRQLFELEDFEPNEAVDRFRELDAAQKSGQPAAQNVEQKTTASNMFVNLPVKDLNRSIEFFTKLGFTFNPQFTDETATCMIIGANLYAMLLTHEKFKTFTPNPISDARTSTEVLVCLSVESRQKVDELVREAVAAGGNTIREPEDHGFMYGHGFQDLDGHVWELIYMEQGAAQS